MKDQLDGSKHIQSSVPETRCELASIRRAHGIHRVRCLIVKSLQLLDMWQLGVWQLLATERIDGQRCGIQYATVRAAIQGRSVSKPLPPQEQEQQGPIFLHHGWLFTNFRLMDLFLGKSFAGRIQDNS